MSDQARARQSKDPGAQPFRVETGENRNTDSLGEVETWIDFYEQLLGVEEQVLLRMRELASNRPDRLRQAVQESNIEPMQDLISELGERLSYWRARRAELAGDQPG
jgi:hypothetical protein